MVSNSKSSKSKQIRKNRNTINKIDTIRKLLEPYLQLPLECDGMTRVITYLLDEKKIPHSVFLGAIQVRGGNGKGRFAPHYWIRLETDEIVDFRSRMWFDGDESIPQGIFKEDGKTISYVGVEINFPVSKEVFQILINTPSLPKA
jgi:hypothetical protein